MRIHSIYIKRTGSSHSYLTGIYYEPGKEPPPEGPPKLHLLIESNEEWRVSVLARMSWSQNDVLILARS